MSVREDAAKAKRRKEQRAHASRNRHRAQLLDIGSVIFMSFALVLCCLMCIAFLYYQRSVNAKIDEITALEKQVADAIAANDLTRLHITALENLDEIKDVAINEMGMSVAKEEQIKYYTLNSDDYMIQYESIE